MFHTKRNIKQTRRDNQKSIPNKETAFWDWYLWVLKEARILDINYDVKGCYVWLDYGYQLYNKLYLILQDAYKQFGHKQMQFPTLIKEEIFQKETNFIRDFEDDVFWVERTGQKKLVKGQRYALRPTSELIIYPIFARWIQSWRDLPVKLFQNVSIFRCETNETRPLIRNRETIGFIEGHAAYQTKTDALSSLAEIWKMYNMVFNKIGIPVVLVEVPDWDRFSGSSLTIDGYVLFPDSKSLELFTSAYLGTTFSEIFDIVYLDATKKHSYAHLLCYGPSIDRILASIISLYGDNHGLVLPTIIAPYEFAIVAIFNKQNKNQIKKYVQKVQKRLLKLGFSVLLVDDETTTPGSKYYLTERLGIPMRIEVGNTELTNQNITLTRRDSLTRVSFELESKHLKKQLANLLRNYDYMITESVKKRFHDNLISINKLSKLEQLVQLGQLSTNSMYLIGWCGSNNCAESIEKMTDFKILGYNHNAKDKTKMCLACDQNGRESILAKRY
jgi:prolyl-tRNA synthetase